MAFVFVLLGGMLGALVFGLQGAIIGAVLMPLGWVVLRQRHNGEQAKPVASANPEQGVAALAARVLALEKEVAWLREQASRTSPEPAAAAEPRQNVGPPAIEAAADETPVDAAASGFAADLITSPVEVVAEPPTGIDLNLETDLEALAPAAEAQPQAPSVPPASVRRPAPPAIPLRDRLPSFINRFLFGGNTIAKVGVVILFLGLAFLLRYAAERVTVPVEWRYAGVALAGAFLLGLGWRLRGRQDAGGGQDYGVILQGAGIGIFYLTALAAIKLHPLLTPALAFAFMAMVAVLGAVLAVMQNAPWLALVSVAEGFAAPVLVSTGGGHHVALFTYLLILDVGIFLMAWFRPWRPLNLVGAVATFTLATSWAHVHYTQDLHASVQFFLLLFFALFTFIGVLFARRALAQAPEPAAGLPLSQRAAHALNLVGRVDSTLTFGVPLAAFGLQYLLVRNMPWGPAWSAFGFALFHLLLGGALLRGGQQRYSLLGEAHAIGGVIFATLTVPLALEGAWTGATWAVEAAGMYWLGARQHRVYARVFALAVLAGAAVRLVTDMTPDLTPGTPLLTGSALGMAILAASVMAMYIVSRRVGIAERSRFESGNGWLLPWLTEASITAIAWLLLAPRWAGVATAWLAFAGMLVHSRFSLPAFKTGALGMHLVALASLALSLRTVEGSSMLANGWEGLAAAVLIGASLLLSAAIELRVQLRRLDEQGGAPAWTTSSSLGLLAGVAVIAMSLMFVVPAEQAALAWPWLGLGALWLGLRIAHPALAISWFGLQVAAAVALIGWGPVIWFADTTDSAMSGPLMLTLAALASGDLLQRSTGAWTKMPLVQWGVVVWVLAWWTHVLPPELDRQLRLSHLSPLWPATMVLWMLASSMAMAGLARWRRWPVMGLATVATLPAWMLMAFIGPAGNGLRPSADLGWLAWPLALGWHAMLLRLQEKTWSITSLRLVHVAGFWFFLYLAAREGQLFMQGLGSPGSAWPMLGFMLVPATVLVVMTRTKALERWPLRVHGTSYLVAGAGPVAVYLLMWLWIGNTQSGTSAPLPYLPLLNPLEMGQGLVLLAIALWFRSLPLSWRETLPSGVVRGIVGATAFALYTGMVLRTCHHWAGVPWDAAALFDSTLTQAALSVAWSAVGVSVMLLGHRRLDRVVWVAGAALLAVVVAKLFLVELADRGSLYRIVSFIVVGVLLLVVGYFAPLPPSGQAGDEKASAA